MTDRECKARRQRIAYSYTSKQEPLIKDRLIQQASHIPSTVIAKDAID
jgi:hypothetical protein